MDVMWVDEGEGGGWQNEQSQQDTCAETCLSPSHTSVSAWREWMTREPVSICSVSGPFSNVLTTPLWLWRCEGPVGFTNLRFHRCAFNETESWELLLLHPAVNERRRRSTVRAVSLALLRPTTPFSSSYLLVSFLQLTVCSQPVTQNQEPLWAGASRELSSTFLHPSESLSACHPASHWILTGLVWAVEGLSLALRVCG